MSRFRPPVDPRERFSFDSFFSPRPSEKTHAGLNEKQVTEPKEDSPEAPEKKEVVENLTYTSEAFSLGNTSGKHKNQDALIQNPQMGFFAVIDGHFKKGGEFAQRLVTLANSLLDTNKVFLQDPEKRSQRVATFFKDFYSEGKKEVPKVRTMLGLGPLEDEGNAAAVGVFVSPEGNVNVGAVGNCEVWHYSSQTGDLNILSIATQNVGRAGSAATGSFRPDSSLNPNNYLGILKPGDMLLLNSDGAHPLIKSKNTKQILGQANTDIKTKHDLLIKEAEKYRRADDVTLILVQASNKA